MPYCDECRLLINTAIDAISVARRAGRRYRVESWREQGMSIHLDHAQEHLYARRAFAKDEDHLAHLICRAVMAKALE